MELEFRKLKPEQLQALLNESLFSMDSPPPDEVVIWRIEGQNIGSLGNFSLLTGLPKAGKGKFLSGIIAAALTRTEIFGQRVYLPADKKEVRYWDTEMSKHDHYGMQRTCLQLMGGEAFPETYKSYHCRKHDPQTLIPLIEYDLSINSNIGFVILDGLLDLIDSFNDEKQSKALVNFLKRITDVHNVLVLGVLHRSKSVDKSMGHLGSAADRAAQSVLKVEKNKEQKQYVLSAEFLRNGDEFNPIAIWFNKGLMMWEQTEVFTGDAPTTAKKPFKAKPGELDLSAHSMNVLRIFNSQEVQSYDELIQSIKEVYGVGRAWAVECIKYLCYNLHLVFKIASGYTNKQQARLYISGSKN